MKSEYVDVLIVGAGISGIGAAYHLQKKCPNKSYTILEGRDSLGGTWDLFKYPGIRSDSDMFTLGYSFRPWTDNNAIAGGDKILNYLHETAAEHGIDKQIRYNHRVQCARWSSENAVWTIEVLVNGEETIEFTCHFLYMCTGYYDYESGYTPQWESLKRFKGCVIHPQKWTDDIDYAGKEVVVIGSGATAVTLIPAMADKTKHITMLQRSPTYMVSAPSQDPINNKLFRFLPARIAHFIARWRSILWQMYFYRLTQKHPKEVKDTLIGYIRDELGADYDVDTHFTPSYNPWDQRLCLVPDSDFFNAIKAGKASIVTDHIDCFTENGIQLKSGDHLNADIIVTATGLNVKLMSGIKLIVDEKQVDLSETIAYKGLMYSNIPNLAMSFGYTNASWTLKSELISKYVCRLLHHMDKNGYDICRPHHDSHAPASTGRPPLDLSSGYIERVIDELPKQGTDKPWITNQNYLLDIGMLRFGNVDDGTMKFSRRQEPISV